MLGGGLSRYHTPTVSQGGGGMAEDLIQVAGPVMVSALNRSVQGVKGDATALEAFG